MKIYLAGPIHGCSDAEADDWRDQFQALVPQHECFNPMLRDYRGKEDDNVETIVETDLEEIDSSDVVIVNAWKASWGTAMEIFYSAREAMFVGVILPSGTSVSPWLRYHASAIWNSVEEAAHYVNTQFAA